MFAVPKKSDRAKVKNPPHRIKEVTTIAFPVER